MEMCTVFARALILAAIVLAAVRPADAQLARDDLSVRAEAALRKTPSLSIFDDVSVAARDGILTVRGCVTTREKRDEVSATLARVSGVREVANDLHVLPPSAEDARLRVQLAQAIYGNPAFRRYAAMANPPIHLIVNRGEVTLIGVVSSDAERTLAFALAHVPGAVKVSNQLRVR
jgi:osmotically-inducible protein OsmY